ncbi:MAG: hypothetical protein R2681_02060 [Pyrinomonadaceae bacterium]
MSITKWMSWEGGVDLVALTQENLPMPNVIVHLARMVHTPVGSAPSGMLLLPNEDGTPKVMGFVSTNEEVGNYFGANIFAGTPFEQAPTIVGEINVEVDFPRSAGVNVKVEGFDVSLRLSDFGELTRVNRKSPNLPFNDDSIEAEARSVELVVNGDKSSIIIPPVGMSGGPAAVYSATGMYSR